MIQKTAHLWKETDLNFPEALEEKKLLGMKFGVPKEFLAKGLDPEVKDAFMNSAENT